MQPTNRILSTRRIARYLVYSSVVIGLALLIQLYSLVPTWLFYLVLVGWVVSFPQPERYSLATQGFTLAASTFIIGSAIQIATIISVAYYLFLRRRELGIQRKRQASP